MVEIATMAHVEESINAAVVDLNKVDQAARVAEETSRIVAVVELLADEEPAKPRTHDRLPNRSTSRRRRLQLINVSTFRQCTILSRSWTKAITRPRNPMYSTAF
jgi:hypothetical protein